MKSASSLENGRSFDTACSIWIVILNTSLDSTTAEKQYRARASQTSRWLLWALATPLFLAGCYQPRQPRPGFPADHDALLRVEDASAPNDVLLDWVRSDVPKSQLKAIDESVNDALATAIILDARPFTIDEAAKNALRNAQNLRWLCLDDRATSADLEWISKLTELRGLSLSRASLEDADMSLFRSLQYLQWLNLSSAKLPPPSVSRLPTMPKLEVLFFSNVGLSDDHIPAVGQFPKLRVLSFTMCSYDPGITDAGVRQLVNACPNLRYLHLVGHGRVTAQSVPQLGKLKELEYMHIGGSELEDTLYDRDFNGLPPLQKLLPRCYIGIGS